MRTQISSVVQNIVDGIDDIGETGMLQGVKLETADPKLLDVRDGSFDDHVAMQPAAIAYFGSLKKTASRHLDNMKSSYERWQKKKYVDAQRILASSMTTKPTKADIEAYIIVNHEPEIEKREKDLETLQEQVDTMDVWYEAWRQKSFSLREAAQTRSDERRTTPFIYGSSGDDEDDAEEPASAPESKGSHTTRSPKKKEKFSLNSSIENIRRIREEHQKKKAAKAASKKD